MKKIITLLLVIFVGANIYGQTALPPAYEIATDTISHNTYLPDSNWQMMADPSGKMTLEQVLQSGSFQDTIRKINYRDDTYWLRYRFVNKMQREAKFSLWLGGAARVDLYSKTSNGEWDHLKTGSQVPWSKRDGLKRIFYIPVVIPPGDKMTIYERDDIDYLFPYQIGIQGVQFGFTEKVIIRNYVNDNNYSTPLAGYSFLLGLFVLAFVINFYFFIIVREMEFLYFSLYLLIYTIGTFPDLPDLILREYPVLQMYISSYTNAAIFFALIYFIRYFLKTFKRFPRWDKWLVALAFIQMIIFLFINSLSYIFRTNLTALTSVVGVTLFALIACSILITFLLYKNGNDKSIWLMLIAVVPQICLFALVTVAAIIWLILNFGFGIQTQPAFIAFILDKGDLFQSSSTVWMVFVFAWVLFMRFSLLRKKVAMQEVEKEKERNALIAQQKIDLERQVTERTSDLKQSLENLKSTQKQLIQSEKMASLGELTAGIAHEIQNPLNFVNNFSDVNKEMLEELKAERLKPKAEQDEQLKDDLLNDVIVNSEKINHHGKRADAIVKGMLQDSRKSTGQKELTDINALCDEYLRLSYHGMRAKDKSFNAEMKTDFDNSIGKINIVPQDIGRVLLNLINNAFYAVNEKTKSGIAGYEPVVSVKTKRNDNKVLITVSDNGDGISEKIKDKIFQPFFTTKPTGQGTGLGLSLSYDMVKAHGGEIKVETTEGEGTEFIIQLPV